MVERPSFLIGVKKWTFCFAFTAVLLLVVGLVLFGLSWFMKKEITTTVDDGIYDQVVVDSKKSSGYQAWENNYDHHHAILYQQFFLYNLTNLDEILTGNNTKVKVHEVGPYTYISVKRKIDVDFFDGGNKVTYSEWNTWHYQPDLSCEGCKETDVVTNISPAYMGALAQAGGELELLPAMAMPIIYESVFEFMWSTFIPDVVAQWRPPILKDAVARVLSGCNCTLQTFYANWANSTLNTGVWKDMTISSATGTASGISLASAAALFNASQPSSLLASDANSTRNWRKAQQGDADAKKQIATNFGINDAQVTQIALWLNNQFDKAFVNGNLTQSFGVDTVPDLAYLQWGEGIVSGGVSIKELYPEQNWPSIPELALFYKSINDPFQSLSWQTSKQALNGTHGLFHATNLADLLAAIEAENWSKIKADWGLSLGDALTVGGYIADVAYEFSQATLTKLNAEGFGLFTRRTIHQWLWDCIDPLVEILQPESAQSAFIVNETTIEMGRAKNLYMTCKTGKNDINEVGDYILWRNASSVPYYNGEVLIEGKNDAGQFQPHLGDGAAPIYNWDDNYIRQVKLNHVSNVEHKGVKAHRYEIDESNWEINPRYYQSIYGFLNMTGAQHGAPVFLTNPHMYQADPRYYDKTEGVHQDPTTDTVVVDIEPITGTVISYHEGLQVNVFLDPSKHFFNLYNSQIQLDFMYPVMVALEYSTLTDKNANQVKDMLYFGIEMETTLFWVFLGVGLGIACASLPVFALTIWKYRRDRTHIHNDGYFALHGTVQ